MQPVNLFDLAAQQSRWLATRQTAIAGNIANVNTHGYKAMDVVPFEKVLDGTGVTLRGTDARHFGASASEVAFDLKQDVSETTMMPSENTVTLEDQLMKAGEVRRSFEMNTAIVKAFHRMMMMSVKG